LPMVNNCSWKCFTNRTWRHWKSRRIQRQQ
jgi:hypothetical protein